MGTQLPPQKKGHSPTQFLVHVYCGQTAGWIKILLGKEVNLYTGDVVLDGVAPLIGAQPPVFGPCLLWLRSAVSATAELVFDNSEMLGYNGDTGCDRRCHERQDSTDE